jgi:hypothetical protein
MEAGPGCFHWQNAIKLKTVWLPRHDENAGSSAKLLTNVAEYWRAMRQY